LEECWPCPVFANYTLAFALQLREKHELNVNNAAAGGRRTSQTTASQRQLFFKTGNFLPDDGTLVPKHAADAPVTFY
jgi:hypothetical protein